MAEALLGVVLEKLTPLILNEFAAFFGIKEKAEELTLTLELIKAVLDDAEEKQWSNRPLKVWLQQLKNAMYLSTQSSQPGCLSSLNPKNMIHRRELGKKLNKIIGRLDRIAQRRSNFDLRQVVRKRSSEVAEWRQTSSTIALPQVYGRDEDKKKVVEFLLSPSRSSESLSVYPIVGLGGLGKTTLVQMVYNDQQVGNHFDLKIWVCVSENFTRGSMLRSILKAMEVDKYESMDLDAMEKKVKELLQGKKYLLVLDDVWKRSQEMELGLTQHKWDELRTVLSCGSKGSSILVSTRDKHVATIMGTCQAHHLDRLSDDDCWSLFKLRAFGADREERAELVAIGKEIVRKCGGSPLAALALGGVMQSRSTEKEWLEVQKSELWSLPDENDIMPVLRLSYSSLTPTLKQCFAFCAIFPKDTEIKKQELIYLWMANGFISSRPNLEVEEVGHMVWNELYQKSFFQDGGSDMHDLVHDLAQSISEEECVCLEKQNLNHSSRNPHHIGFHYFNANQFKKSSFENVESLRTLYQMNSYGFEKFSSSLVRTNHSLRRKQDLTDLSLSWYRSGKSKSIVGAEEVLEALQPHSTLKLLTIRWYEGLRWPTWMENNSATHSLVSLRLVNCGKCKHLPPVGKLPFLKKLEVIGMDDVQYIEENESYDGVEAIPFPSLEELFLSHLANVERLMKRETTHMFPSLSKLHIYKCPKLQLPCLPSVKDLTVWECSNEQLKSISNLNGLNQLHLDGCDEVSYFQEGMMNMTSLATLQISDFRRLKELPFDITKLTALSDLSINKCYNLECLPEQGWEDLSSLRHLSIIGCYRLGSLPDGVRHLASLQSLTIGHCPVLEKRCEKGTGEDWHKIAHVPHVEFPRF
ncbi:hypothetical protein HN873_065628 [Arachis hypogaea]